MICEKCGAENSDGSAFCQKCGASLAASSVPKSKSETKPKAKSKRSNASAKVEPKSSTNLGGLTEMLNKLPVALILLIAAGVALIFSLLSGLLMAIGAGDLFDNGAYSTGHFFDRLVMGIMVAGVLGGLAAIIARK